MNVDFTTDDNITVGEQFSVYDKSSVGSIGPAIPYREENKATGCLLKPDNGEGAGTGIDFTYTEFM